MANIRLQRIYEPEILTVCLIQVSSTDLDYFTARINHFVSFGVTTLLRKQLTPTMILAIQIKPNN